MAEQIGARIKEARLAAGMTQKELAEAVDGLSAKKISEAERGLRELSDEELEAIAKATGSESLLGKKTEKKAPKAEKKAAPKAEAKQEEKAADDIDFVALFNAAAPAVKEIAAAVLKGDDKQEQNPMAAMAGMLGSMAGGKGSDTDTMNAMMGMLGSMMNKK